jgi:hypothetical protein
MLEDSYERLLRHGLRDGSGVIDAALDRERESGDREKRDRCAWRRLRDGTSKRQTTSASKQGCSGHRSVELELKLGTVASARSGATPEDDYLSFLAFQDGLEFAIEQLAVGRRDFQSERVIAGPPQSYARPPTVNRR